MSKNPYEIRLDVLKIAQDMLEKEYMAKAHKFQLSLEAMREEMIQNKSFDDTILKSFIEQNAPNSYTSDQIISKSAELYNFVSSNDGSTIRNNTTKSK